MYLIIIILVSNLFSQNFAYKNEDWILVSNPGSISSMSIMNDQIVISSSTGIFSYHIENSSIEFMNEFIRGFSNRGNSIIHYDKYRDHLWFINNEKIYFKSYISTIWREIEFLELGIGSSYVIDNIGSDFNYIFIKMGGDYLILDPYSGNVIENDENLYINEDGIVWSASSRDLNNQSFSLNKLASIDGYNIISNQYIENNNKILTITSVLSENNNIWVGTNSGELFRCDLYLNTMTLIKNIPHFSNLNYSLLDEYGEWWFSTKDENIFNDDLFFKNDQIFISNWDEDNNKWNYYNKNDYLNIMSKDITCMYRFRDKLYIGTNQGCIVFNIKKQNFKLIESEARDNSDYYVFKIVMYKDYIYMATSEGVKILAVNNNDLIIDNSVLNYFDQNKVYSIEQSRSNLFIASEKGLYKFDNRNDNLELISDNIIYNLDSDNNETIIASSNNKIFYIKEKLEYIAKIKNIRNLCFVDNFIWTNNHKSVHLYNIIENETYEYNYIDGISGNLINHLDCDQEWVWFSTNNGLSIYNWSKYHFNEK